MRSAQKWNRSRGRGSRKGGGNNVNRVYDSAGPEGKVRGTPQQIIDKYLTLARDAQTSGDRVTAENFLQHVEHYQRILIQATAAQEQMRGNSDQGADHRGEDGGAARDQADAVQEQGGRRATATPDGADDIGGMAMIDSGGSEPSLLVDGEREQSRPRRNGDDRRRRLKPKAEGGQAESASEPQAEGGAS